MLSLKYRGECKIAINAFVFRTFLVNLCLEMKCIIWMVLKACFDGNFEREVVPNLIDDDEHIEIENETLNQEETKDYSNGFIFQVIPLTSSVPFKIIHISIEENGSYNDRIDRLSNIIKE
ncbi:hypothetical protein M9Y10_026426 [Tritrichomonas musculus]|uniref:Uncharacterized protein n=1 Tax=Tritrichomonas musculus TaxID=1915356 RepID=A0ABR2H9W6_9EUKA